MGAKHFVKRRQRPEKGQWAKWETLFAVDTMDEALEKLEVAKKHMMESERPDDTQLSLQLQGKFVKWLHGAKDISHTSRQGPPPIRKFDPVEDPKADPYHQFFFTRKDNGNLVASCVAREETTALRLVENATMDWDFEQMTLSKGDPFPQRVNYFLLIDDNEAPKIQPAPAEEPAAEGGEQKEESAEDASADEAEAPAA